MKKGSSFFYCLLLILTTFVCSCKMSVEETNLLRKPDVDISSKQVTVIIHKVGSTTDYINIYRKDLSDSSAEEIAIGVIFPPAKTDEITYRFIDTLVHENAEYTYKVRYHDESGYRYSAWSNEIVIEDHNDAYAADKILTYQVSDDTRFYFDSTDYQLVIEGFREIQDPEITNYSRDFQPMLIFSYDDVEQVFKISNDALKNSKPIPLREKLPLTFMDRKIKVVGILGQQTEYENPDEEDEEKLIPKVIHWTAPTPIKVYGQSDNEIYVPSSAGKLGLDHSRKAE